jgi:hypothetical protein
MGITKLLVFCSSFTLKIREDKSMNKEEVLQELKDILDNIDIQYGLEITYEVKYHNGHKYLNVIWIG